MAKKTKVKIHFSTSSSMKDLVGALRQAFYTRDDLFDALVEELLEVPNSDYDRLVEWGKIHRLAAERIDALVLEQGDGGENATD